MSNPFEIEKDNYYVLINGERQHSLWPQFAEIPGGWRSIFGPEIRAKCLAYIEENWTDMRPASLTRAAD
jgi:MbtH protein